MALTQEQVQDAAARLLEAEKTRVQTGLISLQHPDITLAEAYKIQDAVVAAKMASGDPQIGWKIGLTSRAMQMALNITTPDSGYLLKSMDFAHGATVPADTFIEPRIEAEIAFVMSADLAGEDVTREQVIAATDYLTPCLEILDTRIVRKDAQTGVARKIFDTISDNAANAGVVLGSKRHAVDAFDLRWVGAIVKRDDTVEETGLGAGVLNDPVTSMVWLVQRLATIGQGLKAGQVVLSGSFIRPIEAPAGSRFHADFGPFGEVAIDFA
jgi:2-oxo-hept-3-ene-1,7-dioate hydratase